MLSSVHVQRNNRAFLHNDRQCPVQIITSVENNILNTSCLAFPDGQPDKGLVDHISEEKIHQESESDWLVPDSFTVCFELGSQVTD